MPKVKTSKTAERIVPYRHGFKPQTEKQQRKALGYEPKEEIPRAFIADKASFHAIPECTSEDDWLAQYKEHGQTYGEFMADCPWLANYQRRLRKLTFNFRGKNLPEKYPQAAIYILPVGDFDTDAAPPIDALMEFTQIFYNIPVKKLSGVEFEQVEKDLYWWQKDEKDRKKEPRRKKLRSRYDENSGHIQLQVDSSLLKLKFVVPDDAVCVIALSAFDLFADDPDLFVAGMAAGEHRVAIFSLFRYDPNLTFSPEFWHSFSHSIKYKREERSRLILLRSCRLLVHEIAHLLGVDHCISYACCMNGSGHLEEDFRQPMFLCPVDLRKLQTLCGFDVITRYKNMAEFFKKHGMKEEEDWVVKRCELISKK